MKPGLQFRLHQQLALTPQLQQAIRLLQLSSVELEAELRQLAEANPMLMLDDLDGEPEAADGDELNGDDPTPDDASTHTQDERAEFVDTPLEFSSNYSRSTPTDDSPNNDVNGTEQSLREYLLWQLNLSNMETRDQAITGALIDAIEDNGYLLEDNASIAATLAPEWQVEAEHIEAVRQRLLGFDPIGIGSRNLRECLSVQLALLPNDTCGRDLAMRLVDTELDLLARGDIQRLAYRLHASPATLDVAIALVRSLNPRPGSHYDSTPTEYVTPDAYARQSDGRWYATLSPDSQPHLQINRHYCGLMAKAHGDDATYLRGQLQEARWLLKSLQSRADTILKVANTIVRTQSAFLDYGPEAMRPLVLREVAEEVEMHESTISRVTTRKYLHTPRGIYEFKYFFSSGVSTEDGGSASATAVQAMIRKLVDAEDRRHPLSDQALAKQLQERGIHVARRTVAKYREALRIANSSERINMEVR